MFSLAAFSEAPFSAQGVSNATITAGTQVITSTVAGATTLARANVSVSGQSMTSSVGTPTQIVVALPSINVMTSSIAGVTTGVIIPIGSANLGMTSTVQAMGTEYTLKLIKIPETNLLTGSTGTPSLFTWVDVNDNVTAETWTDVETEDSTESWSNV